MAGCGKAVGGRVTARQIWSTALVLTAFIVASPTLKAQMVCPEIEGYNTLHQREASMNDITRVDGALDVVRAACEAVPSCVGFNSNGWLKQAMINWKIDPSMCSYVRRNQGPRKCPDFPGFVTHAGRDFDGTDASQPALWDPLAAHAACRANPWCQGFNSKGHTKQIVGSLKSDSALCSYVRESSAAVAWKDSAPDRIAVRIGVGRGGQNCLTVSSGDWAVTQRPCGTVPHGQKWTMFALNSPADPITRHNKLYRLIIDGPADAKSNFRGGCLTKGHGSTGSGGAAYIADCLPLTSVTGINVHAHVQQWALMPVTLEGSSGYRVCHRVTSYCLQMGDDLFSGDRVYDRWLTDDIRQMFVIVLA